MKIVFSAVAIGLAVAIGSGAALAQSGGSWNDVVNAASREGSVLLYTSTPPAVVERITADFQTLYPAIKVGVNRNVTGVLVTKINQERQANVDGADVLISSEIVWYQERAAENALLRIGGPAAAAWPAAHMYRDVVFVGSLEPVGILYNTNLIKTPVAEYKDLLKPELKGKVATSVLNGPTLVAWYDWLEKTQGGDFLQKMAAQQPRMYSGAVTGVQGVASGEVAATFFMNASAVQAMVAQGAPIKFVIPKPTRGLSFRVAVLGWSKRPNAARVLADYLMSRRGQQVWNGKGDAASPMAGIAGSLDSSTFSTYDPKDYPQEVIDAYTKKWDGIFRKP